MLRVGLTGGIGSGKTTVAELFRRLGAPVIDADAVARSLVEPGQPALEEIARTFGPDMVSQDGRLDREKLKKHIFASTAERKRLEAILHPLIFEEIEKRVRQLEAPYVLLCIPLLIETKQHHRVDRVLVVDCLSEIQYQRVQSRDNLDHEAITRVLEAQVSRAERLAAADDIIENNAGRSELETHVLKLHNFYLSLSTKDPR